MLIAHVPLTAIGVVNEQVVAGVRLYRPPMLTGRVSAVICSGSLPVFVTVTTLVTGARTVGIVNISILTPITVVSVPFVAAVKLGVPCRTVNVTALLVAPFAVTVTFLAPAVAVAEIVNVAVTVVLLTTTTLVTPMPVPETVTAVVPVRLVPVRVTLLMTVPREPELGAIEVSVGVATPAPVRLTGDPETGTLAVIVTEPLYGVAAVGLNTMLIVQLAPAFRLPPQVPGEAVERENGAVTATVIPVACDPPALLSVRVLNALVVFTASLPNAREVGVTARTAACRPWNSVAPTSKRFGLDGSGLGFPKKSIPGAGPIRLYGSSSRLVGT